MLRVAALLSVLLGAAAVPSRVEPGVSLLFRVEPVEGVAKETPSTALLDLLRQRIDGEVSLTQEAPDVVSVRVPLSTLAAASLMEALPAEGTSLYLASAPPDLDEHGGIVLVDDEVVRYQRRIDNKLVDLERGALGTRAAPHAGGAAVRVIDKGLLRRIESVGQLRFLIEADDGDFRAAGTDQEREREKLDDWLFRNDDPAAFNRLPFEDGGPPAGIGWFRFRTDDERVVPLIVTQKSEWTFGSDDLERVERAADVLGYPGVRFDVDKDRRAAFADFTGAHVNEALGIVLDGEVVMLGTINERLPDGGIISGGVRGFELAEAADLVAILSHGPLPGRPGLVGVRVH